MHPLEQALLASWPVASWGGTRLLVGVSGGADSVALLRALTNTAPRPTLIHAVHFNHQWRGAESDYDEHFVRQLCQTLAVELNVILAEDYSPIPPQKTEQAARAARYECFTRVAYRVGARYVVTAHTASDRIETMLHHLCRGTGLSGVATPLRIRALADELVLVRPLLTCQREDILNYLSALGQAFCEDSSNLNEAYKRNFIRHSLLPMLRASYGPNVDEHLLGFSTIAEECNQALQHYALRWLNESGIGGDENMFRQSAFTAEPWPVIQLGLELFWKRNQWPLQAMTRQHWDQIREIVSADDDSTTWRSRLNLPNNLLLLTKRSWIKIESPFSHKL